MSLITNIRNFFKRIFNKDVEALPKPTEELYKQLRLGNLEPKYIPDEYRDKIAALLKEEKMIKQKQIKEINQKIHNY